ncbi:hypothetical protein DXG03_002970 [Asterophora parasitica]|uniref:DUF6699 domain-containing protein n=1 Tax=Asterophora parasitica TaxID=117018 RepID=A0A9P7KBZ4_9AGAR|nr:hypothetical protein DXG03_002970 [Asterophora parasitica]
MSGKPIWMQHGGFYEPIDDLSTPWVGSPIIDKPQTAPYAFISSPAHPKPRPLPPPTTAPEIEPAVETTEPYAASRANRGRRVISRALRKLADMIAKEDKPIRPSPVPVEPQREKYMEEEPEEVPLRDWKAWGYYAYPKLHGFYIKNFPPEKNIPPSVDVEEVFESLLDRSNPEQIVVRPERWIRGLEHPALPPRPKRWVPHRKGDPLPFPWECQLNPFLQHIAFGRPPLDWDISDPSSNCFMGRTDTPGLIPLSDADKAQPATYPFVTHMYINSMADDPYPDQFWPFFVNNENGITVKDVLDAVYMNFQEYLSIVEFVSWEHSAFHKQNAARIAFEARWGHLRGQQARRLLIFGTHCMFRGLEPHPNREGWTMFVGLA